MESTFYKYHSSGLKTLLSAPTTGISRPAQDQRDLTEKELDEKIEHHNFWMDRKHEREEYE